MSLIWFLSFFFFELFQIAYLQSCSIRSRVPRSTGRLPKVAKVKKSISRHVDEISDYTPAILAVAARSNATVRSLARHAGGIRKLTRVTIRKSGRLRGKYVRHCIGLASIN